MPWSLFCFAGSLTGTGLVGTESASSDTASILPELAPHVRILALAPGQSSRRRRAEFAQCIGILHWHPASIITKKILRIWRCFALNVLYAGSWPEPQAEEGECIDR
jgi:hypothetical protein